MIRFDIFGCIYFCCLPIVVFSGFITEAICQELSSADRDRAVFVLAANRDTIGKVKTGVVEVKGRLEESDGKWGDLKGSISLLIAFDFVDGNYRFDRREPTRIAKRGVPLTTSEWDVGVSGGQFVRTPSTIIHKRLDQDIANVNASTRDIPDWIKAFDIRSLGLAHQGDLSLGTSYETICDAYDKLPPTSIEDEAGLVKITWRFSSLNKRCVWFDPKMHHSAVRLAIFSAESIDSNRNPIWKGIDEEYSVDYLLKNDVFVPVTIELKSKQGAKTEVLGLDWKVVNKPINPKMFTVEGIDAGNINYVVDDTSGVTVVERINEQSASKVGTSSIFWFRALVVGVILGIVTAVIWIKAKSKQ